MKIIIVGMHDDTVALPNKIVEAEADTKQEVEEAINTCELPRNYHVAYVLVGSVVVWKDGEWTTPSTNDTLA